MSAAWVASALGLSLLASCDPGGGGTDDAAIPTDGSLPTDGTIPVDGAPPVDGAVAPDGAALDGATEADGAVGGDAATPDGATGADGGPCGACVPASECEMATCTELGCIHEPVADGTTCTAAMDGICVSSACVMRGCGDGYREPGPTPAREGCDDGNTLAGDACDPACVPSVLVVASRSGGEDWPAGPAPSVGVADDGGLLFVWTSLIDGTPEDTVSIHARRYDAAGVGVPSAVDPIEIDAGLGTGWNAEPSVAGLPGGGWVVTWTSPTVDGDLGGIAYRIVRPDGSLGAIAVGNTQSSFIQHQPQVARLMSGFVVVWTDEAGLTTGDELAGVRARRFMADGTPVGGERVAPTATGGDEWAPAVASRGDDWFVVWVDGGLAPTFDRQIRGRRFSGSTAVDTEELVVSPGGGEQAAVVALEASAYVVAWVDRSTDPMGDVLAREVMATGVPASLGVTRIVTAATGAEVWPTVAPLAGSDYVVAWQDGGARRGGAFASVSSTPLPMTESTALAGHLMGGLGGDLGVVRGTGGVWFVWSDAGSLGDPGAYRSNVGYLLPVN